MLQPRANARLVVNVRTLESEGAVFSGLEADGADGIAVGLNIAHHGHRHR